MKRNHRDGTTKGRDRPRWHATAVTKWDAGRERRQAEWRGLRRLVANPEADVLLPARNRHAGDPWRWD